MNSTWNQEPKTKIATRLFWQSWLLGGKLNSTPWRLNSILEVEFNLQGLSSIPRELNSILGAWFNPGNSTVVNDDC